MKKSNKLDEKAILENYWSDVIELYSYDYAIDLEKMKHMIYDTYHYFREKKDEPFEREDLRIYRYMVQFLRFDDFPNNIKQSYFYALSDFTAGLCVSIEMGFDKCTYMEDAIRLGTEEAGDGWGHIEADMSSYESFEKEFEKDQESYSEWLDEETEGEIIEDWSKTKEASQDFLLCCCFGQSKDLVKGSIDKGYLDMAAHTLTGFGDNYELKWEKRYNASKYIRKALEEYDGGQNFKEWHQSVIGQIKSEYMDVEGVEFKEGQAQKWLNMTIKYLYVLKQLLSDNDERLVEIKSFLDYTDESMYNLPIDSYVLKGSEISEIKDRLWSQLDEEKYNEVMEFLGKQNGFVWELENWEKFSEKYSTFDKESYAMYCKKKEK